jgi:hypothetical protein
MTEKDLDEAKMHGVTITNTPAPLSAEAVAQHAIAFILALSSRIVEADKFVREGKYVGWEPMHFMGTDFLGKTLAKIAFEKAGIIKKNCPTIIAKQKPAALLAIEKQAIKLNSKTQIFNQDFVIKIKHTGSFKNLILEKTFLKSTLS